MYISERILRDNFWKYYNGKNRAVKYQFESELREGGVDFVKDMKRNLEEVAGFLKIILADRKQNLLIRNAAVQEKNNFLGIIWETFVRFPCYNGIVAFLI